MRRYFFGLLALILFGCVPQQNIPADQSEIRLQTDEPVMSKTVSLPDLGPAPELTNDTWLNVSSPLRLENLRGKVVLIDMWTFG